MIKNLGETLEENCETTGKFERELMLAKYGCPLCTFVKGEIERTGEVPIEEWIYLSHLKKSHDIEI